MRCICSPQNMHPLFNAEQSIYLNYLTYWKTYSQNTNLYILTGLSTPYSTRMSMLQCNCTLLTLITHTHWVVTWWISHVAALLMRTDCSTWDQTGHFCHNWTYVQGEIICLFSGRFVVRCLWMLVCVLTAAAYSPYVFVGVGTGQLCNFWVELLVD